MRRWDSRQTPDHKRRERPGDDIHLNTSWVSAEFDREDEKQVAADYVRIRGVKL